MAVADSKTRIAITIDKAVLERLDAYCKRSGMSRSQYISYCVAHQLDSEAQITNGVVDAVRGMFAGMKVDEEKLAEVLGAL